MSVDVFFLIILTWPVFSSIVKQYFHSLGKKLPSIAYCSIMTQAWITSHHSWCQTWWYNWTEATTVYSKKVRKGNENLEPLCGMVIVLPIKMSGLRVSCHKPQISPRQSYSTTKVQTSRDQLWLRYKGLQLNSMTLNNVYSWM